MKNIKAQLSLILVLCSISALQAQEPTFLFDDYKGEVVKVYEASMEVFLRTDIWDFKKKEFRFGKIKTSNDNGQPISEAFYIFDHEPYFTTKFNLTPDGRLKSGEIFNNRTSITTIRYVENSLGLIDSMLHINKQNSSPYKIFTYQYQKDKLIACKWEEMGQDTFMVDFIIDNKKVLRKTKTSASGTVEYFQNMNTMKKDFLQLSIFLTPITT